MLFFFPLCHSISVTFTHLSLPFTTSELCACVCSISPYSFPALVLFLPFMSFVLSPVLSLFHLQLFQMLPATSATCPIVFCPSVCLSFPVVFCPTCLGHFPVLPLSCPSTYLFLVPPLKLFPVLSIPTSSPVSGVSYHCTCLVLCPIFVPVLSYLSVTCPIFLPVLLYLCTCCVLSFYPSCLAFLCDMSYLSTCLVLPFNLLCPIFLPILSYLSTCHVLPFHLSCPTFLPVLSYLSTCFVLPVYLSCPTFLPVSHLPNCSN